MRPHQSSSSGESAARLATLGYDPRTRALQEGNVNDLSDIYSHQEPHPEQNRGADPSQQPSRLQPRHHSSTAAPSSAWQAISAPLTQRHSDHDHLRQDTVASSSSLGHSAAATSQYARPPYDPPRRGSSLQPTTPQSYTYVRGQDDWEDIEEEQSWHDSNTPTQTASPVYSDEYSGGSQKRLRHMDLERAFPAGHGFHANAYAGAHQQRQPLVNYVRNEWKHHQHPQTRQYSYSHKYDLEDEDTTNCEDWADFCTSRVCRRYTSVAIVMIIIFVFIWKHYLGPEPGDRSRLKASIRWAQGGERPFFGMHERLTFADTIQVAQLERWKVPGSNVRREGQTSKDAHRRLVVVGDIHGCADELRALLDKVAFNPETDHLVTTGDMVSRGPASIEVMKTILEYNASCVRGNHEDRVLLAHRDLLTPSHRKAAAEGLTSVQPIKQGARSDLELASELKPEHLAHLSRCPLILDLGAIPGMGNVAVAHAGLVPLLALSDQDPFSVMNMRAIDLRNHVPSRYAPPPNPYDAHGRSTGFKPIPRDTDRDRNGLSYAVAWPQLWDVAQSLSPAANRTTVVYGHDEWRGFAMGDWHYGLDSGCVSGGKLTALVISGNWRGLSSARTELVSVDCKMYIGTPPEMPALGGS